MRAVLRPILAMAAFFLLGAVQISPAAAAAADARSFATDIGNKALAVMSNQSLGAGEKRQKIEVLFIENVDIEWIAKFVLGKSWRTATDEQKTRYLAAYKAFIVRNYTSRFTEYTNEKFKVNDVREEGVGKYYLAMEILRPGQQSVLIDYRIRENASKLKIIDIVVEGISLIATQRSEFASVISSKGLDYLIEQLNNKNSPLQKGAASQTSAAK